MLRQHCWSGATISPRNLRATSSSWVWQGGGVENKHSTALTYSPPPVHSPPPPPPPPSPLLLLLLILLVLLLLLLLLLLPRPGGILKSCPRPVSNLLLLQASVCAFTLKESGLPISVECLSSMTLLSEDLHHHPRLRGAVLGVSYWLQRRRQLTSAVRARGVGQ